MAAALEEAALLGETHYLTEEAEKACRELGFAAGFHQGIRGSDGRKLATELRARLLQALQRGLAEGQAMALQRQFEAPSAQRSNP